MGSMHRQEGLCVRPQRMLSYAAAGTQQCSHGKRRWSQEDRVYILERPCQAARHHPPGQCVNKRLAEGNCLHHLWKIQKLFLFTSCVEMRFSHFHLIPSSCLTLSEHMHMWNQTEINSSPLLAFKWPFSGRYLLGLLCLWNG